MSRRTLSGLLLLAVVLPGVAPAADPGAPAAAAVAPVGGPERIELSGGSALEGEVVLERADRVFVDLGFGLVEVPREAILARSRAAAGAEAGPRLPGHGEDLFREGAGGPVRSVRELAAETGGAVVLVQTPVGLGSGFLVHPDGYVVTNDHVIAGENRISVTVFESGERELRRRVHENVRIVAASDALDLALLKIEADPGTTFPTVALGDSYALRPGQPVFAIGSPLGLERTVSEGIVSLRNRPIEAGLYIQTTTQINPGNSGGPLFNLRGEVVGVNNMKIVAAGAEGLGFAIPVATLRTFLRNRDAYAFDPRNPNAGFRYNRPPAPARAAAREAEEPVAPR